MQRLRALLDGKTLIGLLKKNLIILVNAGSIVGTTAVTSVLGFAYWWVAARLFSTHAYGLAIAMNSLMVLLGTFSTLGLNTLLITELPRQPQRRWALINTSVIAVGIAGSVVGLLCAVVVPHFSPDLDDIGENIITMFLFALGVGLTSLTIILDPALVAILRGGLQLGRNVIFSTAKLAALVISFFFLQKSGMTIYVTWMIGNLLSLVVLFAQRWQKERSGVTEDLLTAKSRALHISGPLTATEKTIMLPCPDCGTLSPNSASFCFNCGYPFSPTVEISSVLPQLQFDYGVIGFSGKPLIGKRKPTTTLSANICPKCENISPDHALYCTNCGYPLTPTIELPSVKAAPTPTRRQPGIEDQATIPLLPAIPVVHRENTRRPSSSENARQALSLEKTLPLPVVTNTPRRPAASLNTPRPLEAEETLNVPGSSLARTSLPNTPRPFLPPREQARVPEKVQATQAPPSPVAPAREGTQHAHLSQKEQSPRLQWDFLRNFWGAAIQHHILNLILQAPTQLIPIMITVLMTADATAYFGTALLIAGFIFNLTSALTQVLHGVSSAQPAAMTQKIRFTLSLSFLAVLGANIVLQIGSPILLRAYHADFAEHAIMPLRLLSLAAFPMIIRSHYIAVCRIHDRIGVIILPIIIGTILELGGALFGIRYYGLTGLCLGWIAAQVLEALYMAPTVYRALYPVNVNLFPDKKLVKA